MGRLDDRVKRVSLLIRSFAALASQHPEIDLMVVGDGRDGQALRGQAAELAPGRVRFFGWTSEKSDLALFYNVAECLVLPSRSEGFPTVVGEAMACGTPVIASRVGGVSEMIMEGETGWTFDPADETSLTERLSYAMSNVALLRSMRDKVRKTAEERVSPSVVASALRQYFVKR